jgi:hypothetical protein
LNNWSYSEGDLRNYMKEVSGRVIGLIDGEISGIVGQEQEKGFI